MLRQVGFLDYLAYIPLFLSMHDKMVDNPFDMSNKYNPRPLSGQQRDMNPLGHPLRANSHFLQVPVTPTHTRSGPTRTSSRYQPRPHTPAHGQLALPPGTSHVRTHPLRANWHFLQVLVPATSTVTQTHTVVIYCVIVTRDQRDQRSPEKRALMTS